MLDLGNSSEEYVCKIFPPTSPSQQSHAHSLLPHEPEILSCRCYFKTSTFTKHSTFNVLLCWLRTAQNCLGFIRYFSFLFLLTSPFPNIHKYLVCHAHLRWLLTIDKFVSLLSKNCHRGFWWVSDPTWSLHTMTKSVRREWGETTRHCIGPILYGCLDRSFPGQRCCGGWCVGRLQCLSPCVPS